MVVFGMTRPGREPTTYLVRGGHAKPLANLTRSYAKEPLGKLYCPLKVWVLTVDN